MKRKGLGWPFWFGVGYLILLAAFAIFGPTIRHDPFTPMTGPKLMPTTEYWLGTDEQGRDIFARLAYGARISLSIGFTVQTIALTLGILIGILGVYAHRFIAMPLMRFTDGMFAFPDILLAILIIGLWTRHPIVLVIALAITAWPTVARLVKTQVETLKEREYVTAAEAMGAKPFYIVKNHILPHLWRVLLAVSMVEVAAIILAESTLSFLGIGIQAPTPSWGSMINDGRAELASNPQLILWPCIVLSLTIFALNFVGDGLRALADSRRA